MSQEKGEKEKAKFTDLEQSPALCPVLINVSMHVTNTLKPLFRLSMVDDTLNSSALKAEAGRLSSLRPARTHVLKTSKPKDKLFLLQEVPLSLFWVTRTSWPPASVLTSPTQCFEIFFRSGSQDPWLTWGLLRIYSLSLGDESLQVSTILSWHFLKICSVLTVYFF